ncbi:hypothetical protein BDD12DRAFT_891334 [Trichophaea hybrida]|nr:hypothetical protein BDD12DRAFT_891334 [Trichophaea hybrida]
MASSQRARRGLRRVFLVARPLDFLSLSKSQPRWSKLASFPQIYGWLDMSNLTRHWAMFVENASNSEDETFPNTFKNGSFFEGVGSLSSASSNSNGPSRWEDKEINSNGPSRWEDKEINSIEALDFEGYTEKSDNEIDCIRKTLKDNWGEYLLAWWNCQDYGILLAHLVMGNHAKVSILRNLRSRLANLRTKLVVTREGTLAVAVGTAGLLGGPIGAAAVFGWMAYGMAAPIIKQKVVAKAEEKLRRIFPDLSSLFSLGA